MPIDPRKAPLLAFIALALVCAIGGFLAVFVLALFAWHEERTPLLQAMKKWWKLGLGLAVGTFIFSVALYHYDLTHH